MAAISPWFQTSGGTEKCTKVAMPGQMQAARIAINLIRSPTPHGSRRVVSAHIFESRSPSHLFQYALRSLSDPSASNSHHSLSILFFSILFLPLFTHIGRTLTDYMGRGSLDRGSQRMGCVIHWTSRAISEDDKKVSVVTHGFCGMISGCSSKTDWI